MSPTTTGLVVLPTRLGTVGEAFFQRCPIPPGVDLIHFRQVACSCPGESCQAFDTLLIDLRRDTDDLFNLLGKDVRYEVRRGLQRDNLLFKHSGAPSSELVAAFCNAYDAFAVSKGLPAISRRLIEAYAARGILRLTSAHDVDQRCIVWHSYLMVMPRVRLLHSVSTYRATSNPAVRAIHGRANRSLHWHDILCFKESGITTYDLGGWYAGTTDYSRLTINAFKKQFGGVITREYNCHRVVTWRGRMMLIAEAFHNIIHHKYY